MMSVLPITSLVSDRITSFIPDFIANGAWASVTMNKEFMRSTSVAAIFKSNNADLIIILQWNYLVNRINIIITKLNNIINCNVMLKMFFPLHLRLCLRRSGDTRVEHQPTRVGKIPTSQANT